MTQIHLQSRLDELAGELAKGQNRLCQLEQERVSVEHTLLRIDGAMQLLNELLASGTDQETPVQPQEVVL